ncbi:hypothetical protein N9D31_01495 [Oligoflexaceae bacterium]|nr:hypothetical protein [Oligoflexaceae bacterium]
MISRLNILKSMSCIAFALLMAACSSTDEQYDYEDLDNFSTQSADVTGEASEDDEAGNFQTDNEVGEYDSQNEQSASSNANIDEYEDLLTDANIGGEQLNSQLTDEGEFSEATNSSSDLNAIPSDLGDYDSQSQVSNSSTEGEEVNQNAPTDSSLSYTDTSADGYSMATETSVIGAEDIYQSYATLWWVGYNYQRKDKKVYLEIVTKGEPQFEVFQERNQSSQPELVVRFLSTQLRRKIVRDIDASEFRSPIAYVRMREDNIEGHVDVVLTLRDASKPKIFAKDGNFLLTYDIPDKYLGPVAQDDSKIVEMAQLMGTENVSPDFETGSDLPKSVQVAQRPSNAIQTSEMQAVEYGDIPAVDNASVSTDIPAPNDLPSNFQNTAQQVVTTVIPDQELPEPVAEPAEQNSNITVSNSAVELPDVSAPEKAVQKTYPGGYQAPYTQPYQQRYKPTYAPQNQYGTQPAYGGQQPGYAPPVYQQPTYAPQPGQPAYAPQPAQPTYAPQPSQQEATPQSNTPIEPEPEIDGSGFEDDDSFQDFDGESSEDDIEKFEVRNQSPYEVIESWHVMAVAQFENSGDYPSDSTYSDDSSDVFSNDYSSGGNYDYEGNVAPVAEVTELDGSTVEDSQVQYSGKLITLKFYRADLPNVLKVFTDQTGINFVYPMALVSSVQITVNLKNVPWDAALKGILDSNNLAMSKVTDTIIKIDRNESIANYLTNQNNLARQQARSMPTKTLVFRLSYGVAATIRETLALSLVDPNGILPTPTVSSDERTNSLIVEGIPQVLGKAKAMIQRMDTPTLQAEIAARIVEVSKTAQNFMGVRWGGGVRYDSGRGLGFGSLNFPNSVTANYAIDATRTDATVGDYNFRFGSINDLIDLDLRLQMEEQLNNSETLQSQKILVQDGGNALIRSGKTDQFRSVVVAGTDAAAGGELAEVNNDVTLQLTNLQISNDNMVTMPLVITSDSAAQAVAGAVASTFRREIRTTLVNRSGETVVIGGAYATEKTDGYAGVPFFSKIPIIGALFRQKQESQNSKELLVMLTPNIMTPERSGSSEIDSFGGGAAAAVNAEYNDAGNGADAGNGSNNANYETQSSGVNNYSEDAAFENGTVENSNDGNNYSNYDESSSSQEADENYDQESNQEAGNNYQNEEAAADGNANNYSDYSQQQGSNDDNYQEQGNDNAAQQENGNQQGSQQENYEY